MAFGRGTFGTVEWSVILWLGCSSEGRQWRVQRQGKLVFYGARHVGYGGTDLTAVAGVVKLADVSNRERNLTAGMHRGRGFGVGKQVFDRLCFGCCRRYCEGRSSQ